jgi:hypothetical protein
MLLIRGENPRRRQAENPLKLDASINVSPTAAFV